MHPEEQSTTALVAVEGEKLPVKAEKTESYWARIASRYTVIWRVLLIVLILFTVLFMLLFSRAFTYDSIFCFFKDLQTVSAFVPPDYGTVSATFEEGEHTALSYRGGVAFVNSGGVEVYSPDGHRLLNVDRVFSTPRAVASRKYLLAYDSGGTTFSVTNSYTELFHGETEFPILGATVSDSGHFALITTSDEVLSQVLLYDNNFNLIQRFRRASATVGVSLSDNGKRIALIGATAESGTPQSVLEIFRLGEAAPELSLGFQNEFPLSVAFTGNKYFAIFTNRALRCCHLDGDIKAEVALNGNPVGLDVNSNGILLALETDEISAAHRILALDAKGNTLYDGSHEGDITALKMGERELFWLSGDRAVRLDTDTKKVTERSIEQGATDMFCVGDGQLRLVYPAKVEYLVFEEE